MNCRTWLDRVTARLRVLVPTAEIVAIDERTILVSTDMVCTIHAYSETRALVSLSRSKPTENAEARVDHAEPLDEEISEASIEALALLVSSALTNVRV